jgi:hypothetical protein
MRIELVVVMPQLIVVEYASDASEHVGRGVSAHAPRRADACAG